MDYSLVMAEIAEKHMVMTIGPYEHVVTRDGAHDRTARQHRAAFMSKSGIRMVMQRMRINRASGGISGFGVELPTVDLANGDQKEATDMLSKEVELFAYRFPELGAANEVHKELDRVLREGEHFGHCERA